MKALRIREATAADYGTFAELFLELRVDDPIFSLDRFVAEMIATTLIAEREGRSFGYAFYRPMREVVHLSHLVTAPAARGQGIGYALMTEVARRAGKAGCTTMSLNVRPDNAPAIHLYERFGLAHVHANHGIRMPWAIVDALSAEAVALAEHAREIAPEEDARLETTCRLPAGVLAEQRARPHRVLRTIQASPEKTAVAVFDVTFPGIYPFRAPDALHAFSLLRALRPLARPGDDAINVMVEDGRHVAEALVQAGATLKLETSFMRGAIG
jgi:GNAT superfamily N-acetyltransferase